MNLVAQGPAMTPQDAADLARLAGAPFEKIAATAYRYRNSRQEGIAQWCDARKIDHGFLPVGRRFADLKLLAMDMDSTLITI